MSRLQRIIKTGAKRVLSAELIDRLARREGPAPAVVPDSKPEPMQTLPGFAPAERPIFIIGAPRSGTSITTWALGQHPNIQPMPETAWIAGLAVGVQIAYGLGSERGRFSHLSNIDYPPEPFFRRMGEAVGNIVNDVFEERCARVHGDWRNGGEIRTLRPQAAPEMLLRRRAGDPKRRWIDGTPLNSAYVWALDMLFPEARFIHLVRKPHEVVASLENFDAVGGIPHGLDAAVENWIDHTHFAFLAQKAYGAERVYTARFEHIAGAPREFFDGILEFLGEPWSDDCLKPLGKKINSSNVEDRREKVLERLANNALYRRAEDLYAQIVAWRPEMGIDTSAKQDLEMRFREQCRAKRLIG